MSKITALNANDYGFIEMALMEADPENDFFQFFDTIEQVEGEEGRITVLLKNNVKFVKDLNKNKYIVALPDAFVIDAFEYVDDFQFVGRHRFPFANVIITCTMPSYFGIKFIIVLTGFNSHHVKIVHASDAICTLYNSCLCHKPTTALDDPRQEPTLKEAIEDTIKGTITIKDRVEEPKTYIIDKSEV